MKKRILSIILSLFCVINASAGFLSGAYGKLMSNNDNIEINNINFSLFKGSDGKPTSSYENGKLDITLAQGTDYCLLLNYYSYQGQEIEARGFCNCNKIKYAYNSNVVNGKLFRVRNIHIFREYLQSGKTHSLQISQLSMSSENETFIPHAIYIQYFVNDSLYISSTVEYSTSSWNELVAIIKKFQSHLR